MKLKSLEVINAVDRISSIDVFRGIAIFVVVIYHFYSFLPYGYLGVDLFFVISGFLVGGLLIKKFKKGEKINFCKFFLQRGFKIWPSYYCFLVVGTLLAILFYRNSHSEYILVWNSTDIFRYLFFYENYRGVPFHWTFDHIWSLCVEEHFYILLPLMIIFITFFFGNKKTYLFSATLFVILAGIIFKYLGLTVLLKIRYMPSTHNRIDALGWGVLMALLIAYFEDDIKRANWRKHFFLIGLVLFSLNIYLMQVLDSAFYKQVVFHSIAPACFFLMILGVYFYDFSRWKFVRFVAYYCYNWYLWHPMFVWIVGRYIGVSILGLMVYMAASLLTAMLFIILIEERFLKMRQPFIDRMFKISKLSA